MQHWRIIGNSNVAIKKTGSTYISDSNRYQCNFNGKNGVLCEKLTPRADDRQLEIAIWTFFSPISQFLAVGRCRNDLANHLLSSTSSKIPLLAWELRRYLMSEFQRYNYFRFWGPYRHFRLSVTVVLTYQHYFTPVHVLLSIAYVIMTSLKMPLSAAGSI